MRDAVIQVNRLGKQYHIGLQQERYSTLRESITRAARAPFRRFKRSARRERQEATTFWALKDLDFEIPQGEVAGIIGRNGAGKSTLLKILSRITEPSDGYARIRGRVGSMLEVGTGFHPELTGRENIYLNGAILGMRRSEIERKMDEMIAFSGVEKFINTPVKHYSSGMYLRLAFAVAAHLEPEILLIDEVLAVGDINFQKKCLGKMGDVAAEGRTVLFVSHNLAAVKELCTTCLVLNAGRLEFHGPVVDGIGYYSRSVLQDPELEDTPRGTGWRSIQMNGNLHGASIESPPDQPICIQARLEIATDYMAGFAFLIIEDAMGDIVVHRPIDLHQAFGRKIMPGQYLVTATLPPLWLAPGVYTIHLKFKGDHSTGVERHLSDRLIFEVPGSSRGLSRAVLAPLCEWRVEAANGMRAGDSNASAFVQ